MAPSSASTTGPAKSGSSVALSSAPALILLQVISRLLAFALNQALVRLTSPAIFGAANIQLELLLSTILFLSREGVRGALLRRKSEQEDGAKVDNGAEAGDEASAARSAGRTATEQSLHNISFLPLPAGAVISLLATAFYMRRAPLAMQHQPYFRSSVALYAAGALLELCSEPLYIYAQREGRVQLRVRAEGAAILLKCITTLLGVRLCGDSRALLAFACGQAAYGLTTLTVYLFAYARSAGMGGLVGLLHPKRVPAAPARHSTLPARRYLFDPSTARLAGVMAAQSVLKHLLTEGDKLAAGRLGSLADQGGYALASNYGGFSPNAHAGGPAYMRRTLTSEPSPFAQALSSRACCSSLSKKVLGWSSRKHWAASPLPQATRFRPERAATGKSRQTVTHCAQLEQNQITRQRLLKRQADYHVPRSSRLPNSCQRCSKRTSFSAPFS